MSNLCRIDVESLRHSSSSWDTCSSCSMKCSRRSTSSSSLRIAWPHCGPTAVHWFLKSQARPHPKKKLQHRRCLRYLFLAKYLGDSCTSFLGMSDITTYLDTPRTQPALHTPQNQGHLPQRLEEMRNKEDEPHDQFCKCSKVQQCVFYDRGSASLSMIFASTIHVPALHRPVSFYKPEDGATSSLSSTRLARCTYLERRGNGNRWTASKASNKSNPKALEIR